MRKLLLRFSLFSLAFLLVFSCKSFELTNAKIIKSEKTNVENLNFSSNQDYVYKCQIDIYKHHLSGILIIKKITENKHRVALTTDFGNKLMDFEISDNKLKINYIIPDLDKEMVKNFLKKDFTILLKKDFPISSEFENETENIFVSENEKEIFYWFVNKENHFPEKLIFTENGKEKINFLFTPKTAIFADEIRINHKDFKINILLQKLDL